MRWLIFLLIISCGKHQEPKALDLKDDDGDQIVNAQESEINKYIANVEPIGKFSGKLRFQHLEEVVMSFSNQFKSVNEVMVGPDHQTGNKDYLSEGTQIKVYGKTPSLEFKQDSYVVTLTFEEIKSAVQEVLLVSGDMRKSLGKWEPLMKVRISNTDLKDLINGNAHLAISKKYNRETYYEVDQDESVKNHTYRVFINDGKKGEVLYVSKDLSIEKLKETLKIRNTQEVKEDEFFFYNPESDAIRWYQRNFANGDKALVYSSIEKLIQIHKDRFQINKNNLRRDNGYEQNDFSLNNLKLSPIYLIIRATKSMRKFKDSVIEKTLTINGPGGLPISRHCIFSLRNFENLPNQEVSYEEILTQIKMYSGNTPFTPSQDNVHMEEGLDERGSFWRLKIVAGIENFRIQLLNQPTFVTTGQYGTTCEKIGSLQPPVSTNTEAKFSLEIESYVEKLN